ncbi:MAG: hypothetical protein ABSG64_07765 [Solirubrobacteraceae bacterium]
MIAGSAVIIGGVALVVLAALWMRSPRRPPGPGHVRLVVEPYRNDRATADTLLTTFTALHALLGGLAWWSLRGRRRALALEVHVDRRTGGSPIAWFAVLCPRGLERHVEAALRASYPNVRLRVLHAPISSPTAVVRLRRHTPIRDAGVGRAGARPPLARADALLRAMAAAGPPASVQLVLRPAARLVEHLLSAVGERVEGSAGEPPRALFWAEPRVLAADATRARAIASAVRSAAADEPRLALARGPRGARGDELERLNVRRSPLRLYRLEELAPLWQLPSPDFAALPTLRRALPIAPAPPGIARAHGGRGLLRDDHGPLTIALEVRRQHTAVVGTVEQGKTSYLVASAREDLKRADCAVIVLDPKGDAAAAVLSVVPDERTCTLLDMAAPTCGFNPLAVNASPDAIADQVVGALRALFSEGEVRGSSDRYLRNSIIAVLACDRRATLWDVARLLEVGEAGRAQRARVAERLVAMPAYAEVATFLAEELPTQLADARASTTAKLDAPANKLARVLNSPAVKRVLLNDSLRIDLDALIERSEVLVVRGALGEIGAGNVAVLMQLLLGMLDAALARVQDRRAVGQRRAVALKVDEAPLAINETFAQTLALKRSAGLETVACWQTDAQWPVELREQLDALFAHRVLFATASSADARAASGLLLSEFSDQLRATDEQTMRLATPDVRMHLPRHTAIVSWTTPHGRERPFIATTLPMDLDEARIARHAERQRARGGRELRDPLPPPDALALQPPPPAPQSPPTDPQLPLDGRHELPASLRELLALDCAGTVRWLPSAGPRRLPVLSPADRELLEWLVGARCALSTQAHRRMRPGRALTSTQRQLKRLADAGLLARFQCYREDGGGVPLCASATPAALELLGIEGRRAAVLDDATLPGLREDVHVVGWLLALEQLAGGALIEVLGPGRAVITPGAPRTLGPADLPLEAGLRARDFLASAGDGSRRPVQQFAAVRPSAVAELSIDDGRARRVDLLVTRQVGAELNWLERYDHLLSGWWRVVPRYARSGEPPLVVVICRDEAHARRCAVRADALLCATLARIGAAPGDWERPGRSRIHFAAEGDIHAGSLAAWRVPEGPPAPGGAVLAEPLLVALAPLAAKGEVARKPRWR